MADAGVPAAQRLAEESPVTASLSSLLLVELVYGGSFFSIKLSLALPGTGVHMFLLWRLPRCCTDLTCELSSQLLADIMAELL